MHEIAVFAKGIFKGLWQAIKTDVDVFLMALAGLLWPFKIFKGLSISTLMYVFVRRLDGLMTAYISTQNRKIENAETTEQN